MEYSCKSILALTSQTEEGKSILRQSLIFQKTLTMRIFILNIIKSASIFSKIFQPKLINTQQEKSINQFHQFIKDAIQKEIPNEVILRIKTGNIVETLIRESKKGGYEFIIIDKSGAKFNGALSKREINKFVSKSHCPVLMINKDILIKNIQTIVVPIDISQSTKKRLHWATLFAKKFGAKILIVSALNIKMDKTKSLAFKNAEKIKEMLLGRGIECGIKILKVHKNARHKVMLEYIEKKQPGLVIIRTHQEFKFSGNKIGDFVSNIIHGCKIPVFTVGGSTKNIPIDF